MVLLSEELDSRTKEILNDKTLFPNLKEIIPISQFAGEKTNLWAKNRYLYNLAKYLIFRHQPDIIILDNDMCLFEMYLLRFAKKINAMNICFQGGFLTGPRGPLAMRLNLENAYLKMPRFLPLGIKLLLAKLRKRLGHIIYYWILPLTVGQMPFLGKSSYMLWQGNIGMRDGDCYVVFSKRDFDICVEDGTPPEKLYILSHPLLRQTRKFFETAYFSDMKKKDNGNAKILTIMLSPDEISFRRDDYSLIAREELLKGRAEIIALIVKILKDWKIFIKPHPATENTQELIRIFESISDNIKVADQTKLADELIEISDAILSFPPSSTTIFTSPMQCPGKPVLSLDLQKELLGDSFKGFSEIEYIDNKEKLITALESIRDGQYQKKNNNHLQPEGFSSAIELLDFLLKKHGR